MTEGGAEAAAVVMTMTGWWRVKEEREEARSGDDVTARPLCRDDSPLGQSDHSRCKKQRSVPLFLLTPGKSEKER